MASIITLTTDFGLADSYVGAMKGVILGINREATIVDVTHGVPPGDVLHGAYVLSTAFSSFPKGTVHVAVVDPGVGTERRGLAIEHEGHVFVGPDNGLFSLVLSPPSRADSGEDGTFEGGLPPGARAVELADSSYHLPDVSATFHGRDVFAPVAAHLSAGVALDRLGPAVISVRYLSLAAPEALEGGSARGVVIHIDIFGNAVTSLRREDLVDEPLSIEIAGRTITGLSATYAEGPDLLALFGSSGLLEIAVRDGSAAALLSLKRGQTVTVRKG
jgi:hypothetical protein